MTAARRCIFAFAALTISPSAVDAGPVYDVAADFSATDNPNGPWQYGWSSAPGAAFVLDTANAVLFDLNVWQATPPTDSAGNPSVVFNGTGGDIVVSDTIWSAGRLTFHPGANGENAVVRWTAPEAGTITIDSAFQGRAEGGTTTDVHVLLNGTSLFDGEVNGYGPGSGPSFGTTLSILAGETIDFTVGFGSNGNYFSDTTQLDVTITYAGAAAVPEPASLTLVGAGGLGLLGYARRRAGRTA